MKTLLIYIDGVKCQFRAGRLTVKGPERDLTAWHLKNQAEIERYKELTQPLTDQQQDFVNKCDQQLIDQIYENTADAEKMPFFNLYTTYQALHFAKYQNYLEPLFVPAECLRFGHLGNGVTVFITNHEAHNDYLKIAHISPNRKIIWYHEVNAGTRARVENFAAHENMTVSATQKDQFVFYLNN